MKYKYYMSFKKLLSKYYTCEITLSRVEGVSDGVAYLKSYEIVGMDPKTKTITVKSFGGNEFEWNMTEVNKCSFSYRSRFHD